LSERCGAAAANRTLRRMIAPPRIFDRDLLRMRRRRAVRTFASAAFVSEAAAFELQDRLSFLMKEPVAWAVASGAVGLPDPSRVALRWTRIDLEPGFPGVDWEVDEEALKLPKGKPDLYVSILTLHTVNDLPGALIQIRRALKPGGRFMAALFGPRTLEELRASLADAELEIEGGISPHVHPFVDVREAGALLQRAGFAEPVADTYDIAARYQDPMKLLRDLRAMGETNILVERRKAPLRRATLTRAMEIYKERYVFEKALTGTFEFVFMSGMAPG
jgi:SAM-dependent methyltransferase